jgi:predicted AAA+ superfamily ATPase
MQPWWQVAIPHRDIREGRFDESVFAADLGNVLLGTGPADYTDPETFFTRTYLTRGLASVLRTVLERLAGKGGQGVIQLQTPFGGGKTHTLVAIYHLTKNSNRIAHLPQARAILQDAGFAAVPDARVAAFVGTYADVLATRTPWGELATQLGFYELVKEHDQKGVAPGKERLLELVGRARPVVLLIDELLEYTVKAQKTLGAGQVLAFLQELTEAVAATPQALLVLTLPASVMELYDEQAEKLLGQLQRVAGRVETVVTPVEGEEIYEVIRRRLFESLGPESVRAEVASSYFNYYQGFAADLPAETRDVSYREKIKRAYPFHPELIDLLYQRWGSLPTFQRTRGVLRLLAQVVGDLYQRQVAAPLIHPSDVNLGNTRIRGEFIKHIGREYDSVIASDLVGARVAKIDAEMGTEYEPYRVASGIATAVFLSSFSGAELRRGTTLGRLKLAFLREGLPPTLVEGALQKLSDRLWYLHEEHGLYYFSTTPNLNRIIVDKEEAVKEGDVEDELREQVAEAAGKVFSVLPWPEKPEDVGETRKPTLILLPPTYSNGNPKTADFVRQLLTTTGAAFRVYKNTLLILAVEENEYLALRQGVRRYLALTEGVKGDASLWARLTEDQRKAVQDKIKDVSSLIKNKAISAYRYLYRVAAPKRDVEGETKGNGVHKIDLGIPTWGTPSIGDRVRDHLRESERLLSKIGPKEVAKLLLGDAERKKVEDMWEDTLKYPGLPLLESEEVLHEAIRAGVRDRLFGMLVEGRLYFGEASCPVSGEAQVLNREVAERLITPSPTEEPPEPRVEKPEPMGPGVGGGLPQRPAGVVGPATERLPQEYTLRARIPWDKVSAIVGGVIGPLRQAGSDLTVILELRARSDTGIGPEVLELKVRETLRQIGADILHEELPTYGPQGRGSGEQDSTRRERTGSVENSGV